MKKNNWAHQGDIVFAPYKGEISGKVEQHDGSFIVGYGEATGHHHKVHVKDVEDMEVISTPQGYILKLKSEGIVRHQEHKEIRLAPGTYRIGHEREVDHFADAVVRNVID